MKKIAGKRILMTLMGLDIGGAETHVLELALELKRQGFYVVCASNGGVYEKELSAADIPHYKVSLNTKKPAAVFDSICKIKDIIKKERIDICHAHGRIPAFVCGIVKKIYPRFTFVTTAHWVFETGHGLKYITNWGEKIVAVSEDIKKYLIDNYKTNPNDVFVTINGIDTNKFSSEADFSSLMTEFNLSSESKKIVYISRMDTDRALVAFHLVEIAQKLDSVLPGVEIVIVGDGDAFANLKKNVEIKNASVGREMIKLAGARTDIYKFAALADLFIGVSRSALEAMSCSKPVIVAGNEGYMGLFDEEKLAGGIETNFCCRGMGDSTPEKLYADITAAFSMPPEEIQQKGAYGRELIKKNYSVKKMTDDCLKMYEAAVSKKRYDALISGYYGFSNSGDEALLDAIISDLSELIPDARLCVLSKEPKLTKKEHNVDALYRYNYFDIKKAAKNSRLLISGGGSLLQDITSSKSIWYYLSIIHCAKRNGAKVMIYANGIGPILKEKNRNLTKKILQSVDFITLRDPHSYEEIKKLGIDDSKVLLTADPALSLKPSCDEKIEKILLDANIPSDKKLLSVCVRDWKGAGADFSERLASALDKSCETTGLYPVFLPLKHPEDIVFSEEVMRKMKKDATVIKDAQSYGSVMGIISKSEAVCAMRLHSLVYSAVCGVPTFSISYDPKIDGFSDYVGLDTIVNLEFTPDEFAKKLEEILFNREEILKKMKDAEEVLLDKAKKNAQIAYSLITGEENL